MEKLTTIGVSPSTKKLVKEAKLVYKEEYPAMKDMFISDEFIVKRMARYYIKN